MIHYIIVSMIVTKLILWAGVGYQYIKEQIEISEAHNDAIAYLNTENKW